MPSDTEIIERFGEAEGRISVIENSLENGIKQFERIERKIEDFGKWFRAVAISIFGGLLLFMAETVRNIIIK